MCVRPLLSIQIMENIYCCWSSQESHISVLQEPNKGNIIHIRDDMLQAIDCMYGSPECIVHSIVGAVLSKHL